MTKLQQSEKTFPPIVAVYLTMYCYFNFASEVCPIASTILYVKADLLPDIPLTSIAKYPIVLL